MVGSTRQETCAGGLPAGPSIPAIFSRTSPKSTGPSTDSEVWAALGGLALGLGLSGAFRWGKKHRNSRAVLVPVGLNLAALALLGAVLASGSEPGALPGRWGLWPWPFGISAGIGLLAFRFPRSAGIPLVVLAFLVTWLIFGALKEFKPQGPGTPSVTVQPLSDRETVTAFAWKVDFVEPPPGLPLVPKVLVRIRKGNSAPAEWWWSWAASQGWARSEGAPVPPNPMKFGIYDMVLAGGKPSWHMVAPELSPPAE